MEQPSNKRVRVSYGRTINTGNYESARIDMEQEVSVGENQSVGDTLENLFNFLKSQVEFQISELGFEQKPVAPKAVAPAQIPNPINEEQDLYDQLLEAQHNATAAKPATATAKPIAEINTTTTKDVSVPEFASNTEKPQFKLVGCSLAAKTDKAWLIRRTADGLVKWIPKSSVSASGPNWVSYDSWLENKKAWEAEKKK